jgi:hypothetical protein
MIGKAGYGSDAWKEELQRGWMLSLIELHHPVELIQLLSR